MRLGTGEILVVLVVLLLVFGANKIPQLGDALGRGIRNFRKASATDGVLDELAKADDAAPAMLEAAKPAAVPAVVARLAQKS